MATPMRKRSHYIYNLPKNVKPTADYQSAVFIRTIETCLLYKSLSHNSCVNLNNFSQMTSELCDRDLYNTCSQVSIVHTNTAD